MNTLNVRYCVSVLLLFLLLAVSSGESQYTSQSSQQNGTLVVLVTWGDVDDTPANDVYIEAHGFPGKSVVLTMARAGRYEASLPPGVYDVFVSEGVSVPRCTRVLIKTGKTGYWTLKLENDDVFTDKSR